MKRMLICLFILLLALLSVSCANEDTPPTEPTGSSAASSEAPTQAPIEQPTNGETDTSRPSAPTDTTVPTDTTTPTDPTIPTECTVTFHSNGGSAVDPIRKALGEQITEPSKPRMDNKAFVCWCSDALLTTPVTFPLTLSGDLELYAKWNDVVPIKSYLKELLDGVQPDPYRYIPVAMRPAGSVTDSTKFGLNYAEQTAISSIPVGGYGEQWHMITDNLEQSMRFFNLLKTVEGVTTASVATFNNYFDSDPADTAHHSFADGIYHVTVDYDGAVMQYVLDYTATVPFFGEQSVQIAMTMEMQTRQKTVRIQVGDANALLYTVGTDSYSFAVRYLGVRTAFFTVKQEQDGTVIGQINEHLTVSGVGTHSSADFRISGGYVSAVGNKADGIVGFKGYINELYDADTGILLGYEVRETLSKITYQTLWIELSDVAGMTSVQYRAKTDTEDATFFVNGSSTPWASKAVGLSGGLKAASRRYDVEMRTRYFYMPSEDGEGYTEVAVQIPMLFCQEEYLETLTADIAEKNDGLTLQIALNSKDLEKIIADHKVLIDAFIAHQNAMDEDTIRALIGSRITFSQA